MATRPVPTLESSVPVIPAPVVPASGMRASAQLSGQASDLSSRLGGQIGEYLLEKQTADEVIARERDSTAATNVALQEGLRLETEADLSDPAVVLGYAEFLENLYGEAVAIHEGSEASRARLAARLDRDHGERLSALSIMSVQVGRRMVEDSFGMATARLAARADDNPASIADALTDLEEELDDKGPALGVARRPEFRRAGQRLIFKSAVSSLIDKGAYDLAEQLMVERPEVAEVLEPEEYSGLRSRISDVRHAETAVMREIELYERRTGQRVTAAQLAEKMGFAGPAEPLVEIHDPASPTGVRLVPRSQAAGQAAPASSGMTVFDPATGNPIMTTGNPAGLTTANQTKVQERALQTADRLARMEGIGEAFDAELLTLPEKANVAFSKLKERLGMDISPEERERITEAMTLSRRALEDLNLTLRDMSGAAITPHEADRLRAPMPDPENDSPTEFTTKYNDIVGTLQAAHARYLEQLGIQAPEPASSAQGRLEVGMVVDGFRYMGGDPNSQASWEPVQ
jgi:hypothetical protein